MIGFLKLASAAALMCALVPAASAQESFPEKEFGRWRVYGWDKSCWISTEAADGTSFRISDSDNPGDVYLSFANPAWDWIEGGSTLNMTVRLGTTDIEATGFGNGGATMPPGVGLFLDSTERSHLAMLRAGGSVALSHEGKLLTRLDVDLSGEGYDYYDRCLKQMDVYAKSEDD